MARPTSSAGTVDDPWSTFHAIGRVGLANLPTPLQPLRRLTEALGGPQIWVKRDDCTGLAFGGNKARKLEYVLGKAIANGVEMIVTSGAIQSNHARMTAAGCAMLGLECHLVPETPANVAGDTYFRSGNRLLDDLFGATVHEVAAGGIGALIAELLAGWANRKVMVIPPGASTPLGALGYVRAARELTEQADAIGLRIDRIMLATGSGGMLGGLLAGLKALQHRARIYAVALKNDPICAERALVCARGVIDLMAMPVKVEAADFDVTFEYIGDGYSIVTPEIVEAVSLIAKREGLLFDPVYTGKMAVALIEMVRRGDLSADDNVVMLHSGGAPALYAFPDFDPEPAF